MEKNFVYDLTIDPDAENNTHAFALDMIGYSKRVLEVGCATGYFTQVLAERGCKVTGLEIDPGAGQSAETWAERVIVGNAEDEKVWEEVDDEAYDVITFGDVLEHLQDPLAVLRIATRKLKPSGVVITSLPNIAHGDVRLALLHGSFEYRDIGLLDRTHIRFFTVQSVRELLREAGLLVVDTRRVVMPMFNTELGLAREDYSDAVLDEIRTDTEYETYQFVMKSVLDNGSQAVADMARQLETLSDEVHELQVRNRQLEERQAAWADRDQLAEELARVGPQVDAWVAHAAELAERADQLERELGAAVAQAEEREAALQALQDALDASERRRLEIESSRTFRLTAPLRRLRALTRSGGPA